METVIIEPELSYTAAKKKWLNTELYGFQPKYMPTVDTLYKTADGEVLLSPEVRQTVKTLFAVR